MTRRFRSERQTTVGPLDITGANALSYGTWMAHVTLATQPAIGARFDLFSAADVAGNGDFREITISTLRHSAYGNNTRLSVIITLNNSDVYILGGTTNLAVDQNYHLAVVQYGGGGNAFQLWVNGVQEALTVVTGAHPDTRWFGWLGPTPSASIGVGRLLSGVNQNSFDGYIVDMGLFANAVPGRIISMHAKGLRCFKSPIPPWRYCPFYGFACPEHELRTPLNGGITTPNYQFGPRVTAINTGNAVSPGTLTMNRPSTQPGDFLLWYMAASVDIAQFTVPTGGFQMLTGFGGFQGSGVFYKIATNSEPASYSSTLSTPYAAGSLLICVRGCDPVRPILSGGATFNQLTRLRTPRGDLLHLSLLRWRGPTAVPPTFTPPPGFTTGSAGMRWYNGTAVKIQGAHWAPRNQDGFVLPVNGWSSQDADASRHDGANFLFQGPTDPTKARQALY